MRTRWAAKTQRGSLLLLAIVVTGLVVVPSAAGSVFYNTSAVDQTAAEINVPTALLLGTDVQQVYTGSIGSRSHSWVPGPDSVPDSYTPPTAIFTNFDLSCNPEEPQLYNTIDFQNDCWSVGFGLFPDPFNSAFFGDGGEWGEMLPLTATAADTVTPVVFDHWDVTNAAPMHPVFAGQAAGQGVPGYCTTGDRGLRSDFSFTGATYQSYMRRTSSPSEDIGLDVHYQGVYAPASPDTTAPLVTIAPLLDCSTFVQNSTQTASYSCVDPGHPTLVGPTGVASCEGDVGGSGIANGANLPTATLGPHTLTVTGKDGQGNTRHQTATYTVVPSPSITSASTTSFPVGGAGSFTVNTSGFDGTPLPLPALSVTGALPSGVTFVNNNDGTATLSGTAASGTAGSYPITITAASSVSPSASPDHTSGYLPSVTQSFTLIVGDTDAPEVTIVLDSLNAGTLGSNGWWVTTPVGFDANASDVGHGGSAVPSIDCTSALDGGSGNGVGGFLLGGAGSEATLLFALSDNGTSIVSCTATDAAGNTSNPVTRTVKIDTVAPTVTCPAPAPTFVTGSGGQTVTATVVDAGSGPASATASSAVSTSSPGTSSVAITGSDKAGNTTTVNCGYTVQAVSNPAPRVDKRAVRDEIDQTIQAGAPKHDADKLRDASKKLTDSLDGSLWVDDSRLQPKGGEKVFDGEKDAVGKLVDLLKDKKTTTPSARLQDWIDRLVADDRGLARNAINDATAAGADAKKIADANREMTQGDDDAAAGRSANAIDHYRNAWTRVRASHT